MSAGSVLPEWVLWVQAFGPTLTSLTTAGIAVVVALISHRQANTAKEKLVLDLFEKRVAVYHKVQEASHKVMGPGRPVGNEPFILLHEARDEAQFLFGPEVSDFIRELLKSVANLGLAHDRMEAQRTNGRAEDKTDWPQVAHDEVLRVSDATKDLAALLAPYMSMQQKLPK